MRQQVVAARATQRRRFQSAPPSTDAPDARAAACGFAEPVAQSPPDPSGAPDGPPRSASTTPNPTKTSRQVRQHCKLDQAGEVLLKQAMTELGLSARAHDKVLRNSRTIADLEAAPAIQPHHPAEAIPSRRLVRKLEPPRR